jgi:ubiquinone/menaquinone biosynthesis C-methylase UbiE
VKSKSQEEKWTKGNAMDRSQGNKTLPSYPNEVMVKLFSSGAYSTSFFPVEENQKVLDVGCGAGNNLIFFLNKGCKCFGIDVTEDMVELAAENLANCGYQGVPISLGANDSIPFDDHSFHILLSVNTLHYSSGKSGIDHSLTEFKRVMADGSRIFIVTAGPSHEIVTNSRRHGVFDWEVVDYGFRTGNRQSFFDSAEHFKHVLSEHFSFVETGRLSEEYPAKKLDFLFAICQVK